MYNRGSKMLKFRLWCFINKIKIFKANEKYKKIQKSGKKINIIMLGDSIPKGDVCNERKKNSS